MIINWSKFDLNSKIKITNYLSKEIPNHKSKCCKIHGDTSILKFASDCTYYKLLDFNMSSIAKRCIRGHFTLAYLIIARLINIELDWSVSTYNSVAVTITHWRFYTKPTSTVVINLFFL
jgi:hypothetical protein